MMRGLLTLAVVLLATGASHADHCMPELKTYQAQQNAASADAKAALRREDMAAACEAAVRAAEAERQLKRIHDRPGCLHRNDGKPFPIILQQTAKEICAVARAEKKPKSPSSCNPRAVVITASEGSGNFRNTYQQIVIDNDCPYRVKFNYDSTSVQSGETRTHPTSCAPANRMGHMGPRSSSTTMSRLSVSGRPVRCN